MWALQTRHHWTPWKLSSSSSLSSPAVGRLCRWSSSLLLGLFPHSQKSCLWSHWMQLACIHRAQKSFAISMSAKPLYLGNLPATLWKVFLWFHALPCPWFLSISKGWTCPAPILPQSHVYPEMNMRESDRRPVFIRRFNDAQNKGEPLKCLTAPNPPSS